MNNLAAKNAAAAAAVPVNAMRMDPSKGFNPSILFFWNPSNARKNMVKGAAISKAFCVELKNT